MAGGPSSAVWSAGSWDRLAGASTRVFFVSDSLAEDEQWQEFRAGVMVDPTADLVRAGVYVNISGD